MNESKKDMENIQRNLEQFADLEIKNSIESDGSDYEYKFREVYEEFQRSEEKNYLKEIKNTEIDTEIDAQTDIVEKEEVYRRSKGTPAKKAVPAKNAFPPKKEVSTKKEFPSSKAFSSKKADSAGKEDPAGKEVTKKKRPAEKKRCKENKQKTKKKVLKKEGYFKRRRSKRLNEKSVRGKKDLSKKKQSGKKGNQEQEEERKSGFGRFLKFLICFFILLGIVWYVGIGGIYGKMKYNQSGQLSAEPMKDKGVVNILLIGSDARSSGEAGRSDAMILLSVSPKTKTVHMTSLLRDMYVEIPGHDGNRLNAAYAFGGPELLLETVSMNFGIDVNRYIVVDFQTFANLVDAVGGVDIELSNEEVQWVNAYLNEYNTLRDMPLETDYLDTSLSGLIHLNGPQALAYSRNRYIGSDFGRTERQRKVLGAVTDNISSAIISNPMALINGVFSELTTNLTKNECLSLSLMSAKLLTYDIIQGSIPLSGTYSNASIRGMDVLEVDFNKNKEYIRTEIYGEKLEP